MNMTSLVIGVILATYIIISFIYFRLGAIKEELQELNKKMEKDNE